MWAVCFPSAPNSVLRVRERQLPAPTLRFSELERAIPGVSQKMLIQQLRELERDGIVVRKIYPQVPPKVEYSLTKWGKAMCPALDSLLEWAAARSK
jgi:DNA-binding HxlR family transcriptional regulator